MSLSDRLWITGLTSLAIAAYRCERPVDCRRQGDAGQHATGDWMTGADVCLSPQNRTFVCAFGRSALGQKATWAGSAAKCAMGPIRGRVAGTAEAAAAVAEAAPKKSVIACVNWPPRRRVDQPYSKELK
jgi:hypothetical protein